MNPFLALSLIDLLLVLSLGSDDYRQRESAQTILSQRGWSAQAALRSGGQLDDPEIRRRCATLLSEALERHLLTFGPFPEIDAAWYVVEPGKDGYRPDHNETFRARYDRMSPFLDAIEKDCWPYRNYYTATVNWLRFELESGADEEELRLLLAEMRWRDSVFLNGCTSQHRMPFAAD